MEKNFCKLQEKYRGFSDLTGYIKSTFKVGDRLPSERYLKEEIGYARTTLRESLIRLECFGIISRDHGKPMYYLKEL